jgi:anti-sigma factor RsiW
MHDEIDNWVVADLHGELSASERSVLHAHLIECAACRKSHQETKTMNKILEERFTAESPDAGFEQRMLADFRSRVPEKRGLVELLVVRLRAVQIRRRRCVASLVSQHIITGENANGLRDRENGAAVELAAPPSRAASEALRAGALDKSDAFAGRRQENLALKAPAPSSLPASPREFEDAKTASTTVARAKTAQPEAAEGSALAPSPENFARAEIAQAKPGETPAPELANRKLIRNATVELEIVSFDDAVQKITAFANEEHGYVATTDSQKQANGKLRGQVVLKVLPENLDRLLQKLRTVGELKNQTLGSEDVTKAYLDTDARLKNARVMEQRLIEMLKTKRQGFRFASGGKGRSVA